MTKVMTLGKVKLLDSSGFSLVELIVTIAIIGVLSTLVVPFYEKFSFRAKSGEAKVMMSAIYSAEKAFYSEYLAYHSLFQAIGFAPEGNVRFNIGFGSFIGCDVSTSAGVANGYSVQFDPFPLGCSTSNYCQTYLGAAGIPGNSCNLIQSYGQNVVPLGGGFNVTAAGFMIGATIGAPPELVANRQSLLERTNANLGRAVNPALAMSPPPSIHSVSAVGIALSSEKVFTEIKCTYTYNSSAFFGGVGAGPDLDANGNPFCRSVQ